MRITRALGVAAGVALVLMAFAAQANAATFTVGATDDNNDCQSPPSGSNCTLRQLVNTVPAGSTIVVPAPSPPAFSYGLNNGGELSIARNMTIVGAGARSTEVEQLTANARVFDVQPGVTATISGLEVAFGDATANTPNGNVGGNILNRGMLTLSEDWIALGQTAGGSGGGIANVGGTLTVTHSLIEDNNGFSSGAAGGIYNAASTSAARLTIDNSTVTSNTAQVGSGGIQSTGGTATVAITDSTIAANTGTSVGGLLAASGSTISALNTIVAANLIAGPTPSNCSGGALISSLGHNLETASDCGFKSTGDLQNTDPQFLTGGVTDSGGNTDTIALAASSPAVDAVPANSAGCDGTDQRDLARPQGPVCDIGAYEQLEPVEGQQFTAIIGSIEPAATSGATIDWGDGTPLTTGVVGNDGETTGTHTYRTAGVYHGFMHYTNSDGFPDQRPFDIKVSDAPVTGAPTTVTAVAGTPFNGQVASFTDGNPLATAADFTATISWGDGTTASAGTVTGRNGSFTVTGTHTYATIGSYATTITVTDSGGSSAVAHGTATAGTVPSPVATGAPPSIGGTTAGFTGSVNPSGLPTTASFQYGLDPKYTGGGPVTYTQSTPAQSVGSDFAAHIVTASVTGLVPNATYHVRLVATNSAGTTLGPDVVFNTLRTAPPGAPALGKTFNVSVVSGVVLIEINGVFIPITELQQIPANTLINALHGTLNLTTALPAVQARDAAAKGTKKKAKTQSGTFGGAIFKITQATKGAGKGLATLAIVEGAFKGAPSYSTCKKAKAGDASAAALSTKTLQLLHASAKGKFATKGKYSAATVRGTKWTIADRCDGTLTHDITHSVAVTDFVRHKTIILHAGQSYLAKARK